MEDITKLKERIKELEAEVIEKTQTIIRLEEKLKEYMEKAEEATIPVPMASIELSTEEQILVKLLKQHNGVMGYRAIQTACEEKFEGVRLILKKMKEKGIVDFEGPVPNFSGDVTLLREP